MKKQNFVLFGLVFITFIFSIEIVSVASVQTYNSPYCGPSGGSVSWACGAWPTNTPPTIPEKGATVTDPDSGNKVLRLTQGGDFGENTKIAFKVFDGGWKNAWNADNTKILVFPWASSGPTKNESGYWIGFDPNNFSLTGTSDTVPTKLRDVEWDKNNPNLLVGLVDGIAKSYDVSSKTYATLFDPSTSGWGGSAWIASWGGTAVCIAQGPQDSGFMLTCKDWQSGVIKVINLHAQTINGQPFDVIMGGSKVNLPSSLGNHTISLSPDGQWLAIDTHGNTGCNAPGAPKNYQSTSLFINLVNDTGYEWNLACGSTHWAYGFNNVMIQSSSPTWSKLGAYQKDACTYDSRGIAKRNTDDTADSSFEILQPCLSFLPTKINLQIHLSWLNNFNDSNVNNYPVIGAGFDEGAGNGFMTNEIFAVGTDASVHQNKIWRIAQTWNDPKSKNCGFLDYSSPSVSRDGKFVVFPSDWKGQTGTNGTCAGGKRTDVFVFSLVDTGEETQVVPPPPVTPLEESNTGTNNDTGEETSVQTTVTTPSPTRSTSSRNRAGGGTSNNSGGTISVQSTVPLMTANNIITKTLSIGSEGDQVVLLQKFLIQKGYLSPSSPLGYFGNQTREAVKKNQCEKNIVCYGSENTTGFGMVGRLTRTSINMDLYNTSSGISVNQNQALMNLIESLIKQVAELQAKLNASKR